MLKDSRTIWVVRLAEVQIVAGPGRIVLGAHGELHPLNVLFEVVQRSKDVLHPVHAVVSDGLVSLHLGVPPVLPGGLDGQRLDDVSWRALQHGGKLSATNQTYPCCIRLLGTFQVPERNMFNGLTNVGKGKKNGHSFQSITLKLFDRFLDE